MRKNCSAPFRDCTPRPISKEVGSVLRRYAASSSVMVAGSGQRPNRTKGLRFISLCPSKSSGRPLNLMNAQFPILNSLEHRGSTAVLHGGHTFRNRAPHARAEAEHRPEAK